MLRSANQRVIGSQRPQRGLVRRGERGTAIVEMAIVAPLFFLLIFAMMNYGWAFSIRENMIHSAQEGLRSALVVTSSQNDQICTAKATARARMAGVIGATRAGTDSNVAGEPMSSTAPCTDPANADLTVAATAGNCVGSSGTCMTVTMTYPYSKNLLVALPGYPELVPQTITVTAVQKIS